MLHSDFGKLPAGEFQRPLHEHQERAVRAIVGGKNVVVATGTGPGGLLIGIWYMNPDLAPGEEGPPFPFNLEDLTNLFAVGYEIVDDYVPNVAFAGREGRERESGTL